MSRLRCTSPVSAISGARPASVMWQKKRLRSRRRVRETRWTMPASVMPVSARFSLCGCGGGGDRSGGEKKRVVFVISGMNGECVVASLLPV